MANKVEFYAELAEQRTRYLTESYDHWTSFLETSARLYKYPYPEQLMIYAQRPDATACAEYDVWNNRMGRYVRRGSVGIALLDTTGEKRHLRYVFDVADTGAREHSRNVNLWQFKDEYTDIVSNIFAERYNLIDNEPLIDKIERAATALAQEYWQNYGRDILGIVDNSFLEEYDEYNIGVQFRDAAAVSIAYAVMYRCGFDPTETFSHEDFLSIFDFNTPATIPALGTAVSEASEEILRQIEVTIKNYERTQEHEHEQSNRTELHSERGLPDSRLETERDGAPGNREIRTDAADVSEGIPPDSVQSADFGGEAVPAPRGDRPDGERAAGADDGRADEAERSDGEIESGESDAVGAEDELLEGAGRGSDSERADLQLSFGTPVHGGQLSLFDDLFPTEAEQIQTIDETHEAESVKPSVFSFRQEDIDTILRQSIPSAERMRITAEFSKDKSSEELVEFLKREYRGERGFQNENGKYAVWFAEDGIHMARGSNARYDYDSSAQLLAWEDTVKEIDWMLENGQFLTNVELEETPGFERKQVAEGLWYLHSEFSEEANNQYFSSVLWQGGFPESTERIAGMLADSSMCEVIRDELARFTENYAQNRNLLRSHFHSPEDLLKQVQELSLPRMEYFSEVGEFPTVPMFISDDTIDMVLAAGGQMAGGKERVYSYFTEDHTRQEQAAFLREEYGIGGRMPAAPGISDSEEWHDGKGIRLSQAGCDNINLSWAKTAERIASLVSKDRYLTPEEKRQHEENVSLAAQELDNPPFRREITQEDIDDALREWNGDVDSKRAVVQYMREHERERDTAAWLSHEFGGDPDKLLHITLTGTDADVTLTWEKIQRRIAQLIREDNFLTEPELSDTPEQSAAQTIASDMENMIARYQVAVYHHFENGFDERLDYQTLSEAEEAAQGYVNGTIESDGFRYDGAAVYDLEEQRYLRIYGDYPDEAAWAQVKESAPPEQQEISITSETVAVYPGEKNNLPFDVVIQTIRTDEPEIDPPDGTRVSIPVNGEWQEFPNVQAAEQAAYEEFKNNVRRNAQNFHITDDHLGEGGAKAKFRMNMDAIHLLKEFGAGRQAGHAGGAGGAFPVCGLGRHPRSL